MPPRKPKAKPHSPDPALRDAARETLALVTDRAYDTAGLRTVVGRHAGDPDRPALARALVEAFLESSLDLEADLELPTHFATLGILLCGWDDFVEAVARAGIDGRTLEVQTLTAMVVDAAGLAFTEPPGLPALPRSLFKPLLELLAQGEEGFHDLALELLMLPGTIRVPYLRGLLAAAKGRPALPRFMGFLSLVLLDAVSTEIVRDWLAKHAGAAGAWLVARNAGEAVPGPNPWPELPFGWPVRQAFATFPDGAGSQGLYLVRERPDGRLAVGTAVVNDWRGLADGSGDPSLSEQESEAMLAMVSQGVALVPVPAAYVRRRLDEGHARSNALTLPLPFLFRQQAGLFTGLRDAGAPEGTADAATWARPDRLADTARLAEADFFRSWFFNDADLPAAQDFFADAVNVAKPDLARWLPVFFDAEARGVWQARLAEVAYLFDRLGDPTRRDLAATAAAALAPESGVPLARQPLLAAILDQSARNHMTMLYMRARDSLLGPDPSASLASQLAPGQGAEPSRTAEPPPAGAIYQLKISLKGARPPIWRRVLVPADRTLADLHDVIQAAMGWEDYHLHAFRVGREEYGPPDRELGLRDERHAVLGRIAGVGDAFAYEYDFGDGWEHRVLVEKVLAPEAGRTYPACLTGRGACPPEDSGGLGGYYDKLAVLADPDHGEYEDIRDWMGEGFDPEAFDLAEVNARVASLGPKPARPKRRKSGR